MVIQYNKRAIYQYTYIYILIEFLGGRIFTAVGFTVFGFTALLLGIYFFIRHKDTTINDIKYKNYIVVMLVGMLCTVSYTFGGLSIYTVTTLISKFLIVYIAIVQDRANFLNRFLKTVYVLSIVSIILFGLVTILGYPTLAPVYSKLYEIKNGTGWMGSTYGLFLIVFNLMDPTRNAYMFGEPGEYQMLVIVSIYMLIFKGLEIDTKIRNKYLLTYLVTLLTIQSTTGFINLAVLVIVILLQPVKIASMRTKAIVYFFMLTIMVYVLFFSIEDNFLYKNIFNKMLDGSGNLDLAVGTGEARVGSLMRFVESVKQNTLEFIFGVGYAGLGKTALSEFSTAGLTNSLMMFGLINNIIIYSFMVKQIIRYSATTSEMFLVLFIIINMGISQPDLLSSLSILIAFYGMILDSQSIKNTEYRMRYLL